MCFSPLSLRGLGKVKSETSSQIAFLPQNQISFVYLLSWFQLFFLFLKIISTAYYTVMDYINEWHNICHHKQESLVCSMILVIMEQLLFVNLFWGRYNWIFRSYSRILNYTICIFFLYLCFFKLANRSSWKVIQNCLYSIRKKSRSIFDLG